MVRVVDALPGALEAVDDNLEGGGFYLPWYYPQCRFCSWYWVWWRKEVRADRVEWQASSVSPGTHTLTYVALAVTEVRICPCSSPRAASLSLQPMPSRSLSLKLWVSARASTWNPATMQSVTTLNLVPMYHSQELSTPTRYQI